MLLLSQHHPPLVESKCVDVNVGWMRNVNEFLVERRRKNGVGGGVGGGRKE